MIITKEISFKTKGDGDIIDLTPDIQRIIKEISADSGIVTVFVPGATASITTIEYEPGLLKDFPKLMEKLIPSDISYHHDDTWHDGNGFSHLRASLIGPDITVPFVNKSLLLGTWQQIIFLEFDNRHRNRRVILQIIGE